MLVFDIETGSLPDEQLRQLMPPFDESKVKHPGEFDPSKVKYGRTKDEAKRAEILQAAQTKHTEECDAYESNVVAAKAEYERRFFADAALSPVTGHLVAIGLHRPESDGYSIIDCSDEVAVINAFWKKYLQSRESSVNMVGFNILGFDLPFLIQRSWMLEVDVPPQVMSGGRYLDSIFIDPMQLWLCGKTRGNSPASVRCGRCGHECGRQDTSCSLDHVARALGFEGKNGNGADFAKLWNEDRSAAMEYLKNDLKLTAGVARRMGIV